MHFERKIVFPDKIWNLLLFRVKYFTIILQKDTILYSYYTSSRNKIRLSKVYKLPIEYLPHYATFLECLHYPSIILALGHTYLIIILLRSTNGMGLKMLNTHTPPRRRINRTSSVPTRWTRKFDRIISIAQRVL